MRSLLEAVLVAFLASLILEQGNRITRLLTWCWSRLAPKAVREEYRGHWEADVAALEGPASRIVAACLLGTDLPGLWKLFGTAAEARVLGLRVLFGGNLMACTLALACAGVQWATHAQLPATHPFNLAASWCGLVIILVMSVSLWGETLQLFRSRAYLFGVWQFSGVAIILWPLGVLCAQEIWPSAQHNTSLALASLMFAGIYIYVLQDQWRERRKRSAASGTM